MGQIVMNSQLGGGWGPEERIPLPSGEGPYSAVVVVTDVGYEVHEGGTLRHVYRHRSPFSRLERIEADVSWKVGDAAGGLTSHNTLPTCAKCVGLTGNAAFGALGACHVPVVGAIAPGLFFWWSFFSSSLALAHQAPCALHDKL